MQPLVILGTGEVIRSSLLWRGKGIDGVPTAVTVHRDNTQDKKHFRHLLELCAKVLEPGSLLIFDCGGNTRENKAKVVERGFHYLTLKPKKVKTYRRYVQSFDLSEAESFVLNAREYFCIKRRECEEWLYIYFSPSSERNSLS